MPYFFPEVASLQKSAFSDVRLELEICHSEIVPIRKTAKAAVNQGLFGELVVKSLQAHPCLEQSQ